MPGYIKPQEDPIRIVLVKIGLRVRELRKKHEKNYEEFARKHKINKVTLQRLESGRNFTMKSLVEILLILEVPLEEVFRDL